jgi:hypothetical protein
MNQDNQIIIYQTADNQTQIDVRMENDTVWITQAQMAEHDYLSTQLKEAKQHLDQILNE